ncbi:MAG: ABC transporter permease [Planctomycetes bacterium]|nr:ABC transporter permease [Planctomycetota bacterium]
MTERETRCLAEKAAVAARRGAGLGRLIRIEMSKLARSHLFWAGFVLLAGFALLVLLGFKTSNFNALQRTLNKLGRGIDHKPFINGLLYSAWSMGLGHSLLAPLFVTVLFAWQLAGEAKEGTLRSMLLRPISRLQIFAAKFIAVYFFVLVLLVFQYGLCLMIGHFGLGQEGVGLVVFGKTFFNDEAHRPWLMGRDLALERMALGCVLGCLSLAPLAAFSYLLSALLENPVVAILTGFSVYIASVLLAEVPFFTELRPYLFTTYTSFWKGVFYPEIDWAGMWPAARMCGLFAAAFLGIGAAVFRWRDIRT